MLEIIYKNLIDYKVEYSTLVFLSVILISFLTLLGLILVSIGLKEYLPLLKEFGYIFIITSFSFTGWQLFKRRK